MAHKHLRPHFGPQIATSSRRFTNAIHNEPTGGQYSLGLFISLLNNFMARESRAAHPLGTLNVQKLIWREKHLRSVFLFFVPPFLIELQRAGSACVMKSVPWLSAFTRSGQPPALKQHRASTVRGADTHTHTHAWRNTHTQDTRYRANIHATGTNSDLVWISWFGNYQACRHQVNTTVIQRQTSLFSFCIVQTVAVNPNQIEQITQLCVQSSAETDAGVFLLWRTSPRALRWGWECVRSHDVTSSWSRWASIGPEPNPHTRNPPPHTSPTHTAAALPAAWPLHSWAKCWDIVGCCFSDVLSD